MDLFLFPGAGIGGLGVLGLIPDLYIFGEGNHVRLPAKVSIKIGFSCFLVLVFKRVSYITSF